MCFSDKDPCEMPGKLLKGKLCVWHKAEHNQRPGNLKSVSMKKRRYNSFWKENKAIINRIKTP